MLTHYARTEEYLNAVEATLVALWEQAQRELHAAKAAGDADMVKLARNHSRAYEKARIVLLPTDKWRVSANGDLLIESSDGKRGYTVRRLPIDGTDFAPLVCTCDHGEKAESIGLCYHTALYHGIDGSEPPADESVIEPAPRIATVIAGLSDARDLTDAEYADVIAGLAPSGSYAHPIESYIAELYGDK
ncbi:MAG: hypothetical protein HC828_03615 [Blastochloris sp.]|nr:hypothetical protein [Blastochloris sp.]